MEPILDKRVSTALIALRDTVVPLAISLPVLLAARWYVRSVDVPAPGAGVTRVSQLLTSADWIVPVVLAAPALSWLLAGWWFRKYRPVPGWEPPWPRGLEAGAAVRIGIWIGLLLMLASWTVGMITAALFDIERLEAAETLALTEATGPVLGAIFLLAVVVAPIGEEMFFRGHLFRWTASRCGLRYAHVLTAAIFSIGHLNAPGIPSYAVAAVILGWSYDRWRTLTVPILAHMIMNGISFTLLVLASRLRPEIMSSG